MIHTAQFFTGQLKVNSEYPCYYHESEVEEAINEARIEVIRECYEVVEMKQGADCDKGQIDRQLILDLIDQIKKT